MIFPILLLLGLGAVGAFATYEFSPSVHEWVDNHLTHSAEAAVADNAADAHLDAHDLNAAATANQIGAAKTAQMAKTAKTPQQRAITVQMAELTIWRQLEIEETKLLASGLPREAALAATVRLQTAHMRVMAAKVALARLGVPM